MNVIENFKSAIDIQQRKQNEDFEELMQTPLQERIAKGETMANLTVEFDFCEALPNQWCNYLSSPLQYIAKANIFCENNNSKFREGVSIILSNGNYKFKMEIYEDSNNNFIIAPNNFNVSSCYIDSGSYPKNNWEINVVNTNITQKLLSATANYLASNSEKLSEIGKLLNGNYENNYNGLSNFNSLNKSQNEAIELSLNCKYFHLIQGPPGTGKTLIIAHLSKHLINDGKKVFVTGPTHTAINNCLDAIANEICDESFVIKIGEKYQSKEIIENKYITRKTRLPFERHNEDYQHSQDGIIIGATPYSLCYPASKRLNNWEFDIALIDEASQLSIPLAIAVMSRCKKVILVGDHKQLDPIIPLSTGNPLFDSSIFKKLVDIYPNNVSLLNISYRLNENLIRIPNKLFYNNRLVAENQESFEFTSFDCSHHPEIINHDDSKILFLHHEFDSQGRSPHEASIVAAIFSDLVNNGVQLNDIGIISPYRAQVREIKKALSNSILNLNSDIIEKIFIDTVDRMQGQEKDYIVYSMSNSHPLESKRRLEFFYSPNRLNVAITRARKKCIVIANEKVFDIIDNELSDLHNYDVLKPSLNVFKDYYNLSTKIEERQYEDEW